MGPRAGPPTTEAGLRGEPQGDVQDGRAVREPPGMDEGVRRGRTQRIGLDPRVNRIDKDAHPAGLLSADGRDEFVSRVPFVQGRPASVRGARGSISASHDGGVRPRMSAGTDDELIRLAEEVGLDGSRVRKDSHSEAVAKALDVDIDEMHRSGVNFLSLLIRNRDGRQVVQGEIFTAKPFETIIDDLAPGLPKRSPADILEYVEHHRALMPAHEIAEVFRIPDEDARHRLERLSAAGPLSPPTVAGG